jgi:hypothetical protein
VLDVPDIAIASIQDVVNHWFVFTRSLLLKIPHVLGEVANCVAQRVVVTYG